MSFLSVRPIMNLCCADGTVGTASGSANDALVKAVALRSVVTPIGPSGLGATARASRPRDGSVLAGREMPMHLTIPSPNGACC